MYNIYRPQTMTQAPLFDVNYPMLVNFAAWGQLVGHEITHAFVPFWEEDKMEDIYTNETQQLYNKKLQCFIDQYDKIEALPDVFINGTRSNRENVPDNGGMDGALEAYKKWKQDNNIKISSNQPILPGLEFTEEQLWWISFGRGYCNVYQPSYIKFMTSLAHPPPSARVIGVAQNFKEFADAFQCPTGSPMNPRNKCGFWRN